MNFKTFDYRSCTLNLRASSTVKEDYFPVLHFIFRVSIFFSVHNFDFSCNIFSIA